MKDKLAKDDDDDLLDHYDIDFSKAKPNRFAALFGPLKPGGRVVYLDPEIAERFETSEDVNQVLKVVVNAMLGTNHTKKSSSTKACVKKPTKASKKPGLFKKWKMVSGKVTPIQATTTAAAKKTVKVKKPPQ